MKLCQNVFQTIPFVSFSTATKIFGEFFRQEKTIWSGFGWATVKWMSKSSCASNFAPDRLLLRSLRLNFFWGLNVGRQLFRRHVHASRRRRVNASTCQGVDASMSRCVDALALTASTRRRIDVDVSPRNCSVRTYVKLFTGDAGFDFWRLEQQ